MGKYSISFQFWGADNNNVFIEKQEAILFLGITYENLENKANAFFRGLRHIPFYMNNGLEVVDYLRSKGFAIPWMRLTVDDLIEYGWVKLKKGENEKIQKT